MTERVVHFLEAVKIDEQQRELCRCLTRSRDLVAQAVVEHVPVGQIGERIEVGLPPDDLFGPLLLRHVVDQHNPARLAQRAVGKRVDGEQRGEFAAVLAADQVLAAPRALG